MKLVLLPDFWLEVDSQKLIDNQMLGKSLRGTHFLVFMNIFLFFNSKLTENCWKNL